MKPFIDSTYDSKNDLFYCYLIEPERHAENFNHSLFLGDSIIIDSDNYGRVLGIEILAFKRLFSRKEQAELKKVLYQRFDSKEAAFILDFITSKK